MYYSFKVTCTTLMTTSRASRTSALKHEGNKRMYALQINIPQWQTNKVLL